MFTPHHVSRVTCHVSPVTCNFYLFKKIYNWQHGGDSHWRVCYQRGLPRLVFKQLSSKSTPYKPSPSSQTLSSRPTPQNPPTYPNPPAPSSPSTPSSPPTPYRPPTASSPPSPSIKPTSRPPILLLFLLLTIHQQDISDTLDLGRRISAGAAFLIKILSLCRRLSDISVVFLMVRKASSLAWNIFKLWNRRSHCGTALYCYALHDMYYHNSWRWRELNCP